MTNNYSVLIIGTGNIAKKHSNILKKKNVNKITNISSRKFNLSFLKKNNNFDFAFICSPANMHLNHIKLLSKCNALMKITCTKIAALKMQ